MKTEDTTKTTAPYIAFKSFLTAIETFEEVLPTEIDRKVWRSFSGGVQSQMLSAFKFLGLIDDEGNTQSDLENLVANKGEDRKPILKEILEKRYLSGTSLNISKASPSQFEEILKNFNVSGTTLRKAEAFFINAAQYSGLNISPHLKASKITISATPKSKKRFKTNENRHEPSTNIPKPEPSLPSGEFREIKLRCGGTMRLNLSLNLFDLEGEDRTFVFDIIDKMKTYERDSMKTDS